MSKRTKQFRAGRRLVEEWEVDGHLEVRVDGRVAPVSFHQAIVEAKTAPLRSMRDECRRVAEEARHAINDTCPECGASLAECHLGDVACPGCGGATDEEE